MSNASNTKVSARVRGMGCDATDAFKVTGRFGGKTSLQIIISYPPAVFANEGFAGYSDTAQFVIKGCCVDRCK